ncbi:hypothetical protein [Kitasatospora sp. NPDC088351]|uniref:hypothetical protein n=1 Tax=Kitasatospora sp. NPDC088351 TaxID=3155180 RepID=UPI003413327D
MESVALLMKNARGGTRMFIVIVSLVPLLLFLLACVPAVVFVAFRRGGLERCAELAASFEGWTVAVLKGSGGSNR